MVWGLGQPAAAHWRQWRELAAAIGLNVGQNVAALGYFLKRCPDAEAPSKRLHGSAFDSIMTSSSQGLGECPRPIHSKAQLYSIS